MVHGDCVSIGCYAMTDAAIEQIWTAADSALRGGQSFFRVHIFPFRMTEANLARHQDSEWAEFWLNLRQGYDLFEETGWPPDITVHERMYQFRSTVP